MKKYNIIKLSEHPELAEQAACWFHDKWNIPAEVYLESIKSCIDTKTSVPRWYIVIDRGEIIAGAGVIENDFHERKDLSPNLCALYVKESMRNRGIARHLLDCARKDLKNLGYDKLYLITDHTDFYEKCGWRFLTYVKDDDGINTRMYTAECLS